ncbi:MAG TPA: hypothetical protein VGM74_17585, partial [Burkholderiaceae bacterium]
MATPEKKPLTKLEFEALSAFRFQIRCFERFSEDAVQAFGITPLQYLLLNRPGIELTPRSWTVAFPRI